MVRVAAVLCLSAFILTACRKQETGLSRPNGVAVAADGSLFVMDRTASGNSRVVHITSQGKIEHTFQPGDAKAGLVYSGWDMAVNPNGNVYFCFLVANDERTLRDSLLAYSADGRFLNEIGAADYALDSAEISYQPYNLDVDNRGWIYVTDFNYSQLRVFNKSGQLLAIFTRNIPRGFHYRGIGDVVVDDQRNLLYLTDFFEGRLDQYRLQVRPDGVIQLTRQFSVGSYGHGRLQFSFPQYLAVDETTGIVYVGDMGNRRVQAIDAQGKFVAEFSPPGVEEWQVLGLAVGPDAEHPGEQIVYAADALNHVIWAFSPDGQFLRKIEVH